MSRRAVVASLVALGALVVGVWTALTGGQSPDDPRPNVIIVLWDTVRADRLTPYSSQLPTTPNLARWAEQSVVFEHAVSPGMWTVPAHASMFTGLMPTTHGMGMDHLWLDGHHLTLAEWMGEQGYATYAFSANPNLSPNRLNLLQGFERIDVSWAGRYRSIAVQNASSKLHPMDASTEISPRYRGRRPAGFEPQSAFWDAGPATEQAFLTWLDQRPDDRPFLAYLSYMEAHKPRIPSVAARRVVSEEQDLLMQLQTDMSFDTQLLYSYRQRDFSREELKAVRQVYDATLWDLDRTTTSLMGQLEQRGLLEDTIVVFTSDHGEQLGEHHLFGHRNALYQALLHVPLVITWKGHLEPRRVTEPVSTVDLFDTILDLTGTEAPDAVRSGGNWLRSEPGAWGVFAEALDVDVAGFKRVQLLSPELRENPWERTMRAAYDGRWKLMEDDAGKVALFDLHLDPMERHDQSADRPERVQAMREQLRAVVQGLPRYDATRASDRDVPVEDDEATREYLGVLGYIDEEE